MEINKEIFREVEKEINDKFDLLISRLEQMRSDFLRKLSEGMEKFCIMEHEWQLQGMEYSQFLQENLKLETKRNSLACLQTSHVDTLSRTLKRHSERKPSLPFVTISCDMKGILAKIEQISLIIHPTVGNVIAIPESRIKDWKSAPENIDIDHSSNHIYCTDPSNRCVREYSIEGEYIGEVGLWSYEMVAPHSLAILKGSLYVSDLALHCISKFNLVSGSFEKKTNQILEFEHPTALTFNEKEELYVLDKLKGVITVLNTDLEFIRGYNLKISDSSLPLDIKLRERKIYILLKDDVFWFEEPSESLQVTYNYLNINTEESNHQFCIDQVGNIIRTEANGMLVVNAIDGTELSRKSFHSGKEESNLTGICVVKNGWVAVAVDNKDTIMYIVNTS